MIKKIIPKNTSGMGAVEVLLASSVFISALVAFLSYMLQGKIDEESTLKKWKSEIAAESVSSAISALKKDQFFQMLLDANTAGAFDTATGEYKGNDSNLDWVNIWKETGKGSINSISVVITIEEITMKDHDNNAATPDQPVGTIIKDVPGVAGGKIPNSDSLLGFNRIIKTEVKFNKKKDAPEESLVWEKRILRQQPGA